MSGLALNRRQPIALLLAIVARSQPLLARNRLCNVGKDKNEILKQVQDDKKIGEFQPRIV
jgi:hypothetical protein